MTVNKSTRSVFALLLLLCFSVAALPVDFFHSHSAEPTQCQEASKHHSCQHKVHLSKKTYCFACTLHFDKDFAFSYDEVQVLNQPSKLSYFAGYSAIYIFHLRQSCLRGPPSALL
jgi:hypothetical protein